MSKSIFHIILFSLLITYISPNDSDPINTENITNATCNVNEECDQCLFCGNTTNDYSKCNFDNIFCHHTQKDNYEYNTELQNKYSNYFREDTEIDTFCGEKNIKLDSLKKSFTILETDFNSNFNILSKKINCDYKISNKYYFEHDIDQAKLHLEIKNLNSEIISEDKKIKFNLIMIYSTSNSLKFSNLNDDNIRNNAMNKTLDKITSIDILIDFKNDINNNKIDEYLEISIITENPSKKTRVIYIIVLIICGFLILLIIILIILYICIKKKIDDRYREAHEEERLKEEKKIENKKKIEELYLTDLKVKTYNKELLVNNCENCSICTENFVEDKSQVIITPCNHIFHPECIKPWIENNILEPKCPNCNFNILEKPKKIIVKSINNNIKDNIKDSIRSLENAGDNSMNNQNPPENINIIIRGNPTSRENL